MPSSIQARPGFASSVQALHPTDTLTAALQRDVWTLAEDIGERNTGRYDHLERAARFIEASFDDANLAVTRQTYDVDRLPCHNIIAEIPGSADPDHILVIGAHYDTVRGSPGANDNASGVAVLLALARAFGGSRLNRTVRLVAFANEEPPYVRTAQMGSLVYATECRRRQDRIVGMLSLETLGYFPGLDRPAGEPRSIRLLRPLQGKFLALVGNLASRSLLRETALKFRRAADIPVRAMALPGFFPGVKSSDHWAFWQQRYPALMVTDTAPFRYPFYHTAKDTPDQLSYRALVQIVTALRRVIMGLATQE